MKVAAISAALLAAWAPGAPSSPPAPLKAKENPVVCRRIVTTGTRFARTVCATRLQWAELSAEGRASTESIQSHRDYALPPK